LAGTKQSKKHKMPMQYKTSVERHLQCRSEIHGGITNAAEQVCSIPLWRGQGEVLIAIL
jgi:hypothetical protein